MVRDLSSTRTSGSLCSQELDHKEVSLKKIYEFCKLFTQNLLYHVKDSVLCKMIMGKRKPWWIPLFRSIYFCACYENTIEHISYWHIEWVLSWLCEFPYHFSSSSNVAIIVLAYKKGRSTWTKRQCILLKQAMYQKKTQAYIQLWSQ